MAQATPDRSKAKTLAELAIAGGAIAACNGGYFSPDFGPAGLEVAQGVRTGKWQEGLPFGGVLCVSKGEMKLLPDAKFHDGNDATDLVQCCPMLVQDGVALNGIGGANLVARTFVATDGAYQWCIGYSPRAALENLAGALTAPVVLHEWRVKMALNLDGGPSSGLWWKPLAGEAQAVRLKVRVRNVIMVVPKQP